MELYNAIVKMEQGGSVDGLLQVNFIRTNLHWFYISVLC